MAEVKKATFEVIEGVLVYCKLAQPDTKYQSKDTEYTITVLIDEDKADEWDEKFGKQPAKKIKATDFEGKFKIPLPECFKGMKNVYNITLKKDAVVEGKEMFPEHRPKVLLETDDERIDITESRLVANGSYGKVSYRVTSNAYGDFARLANVLIKEEDFVEYEMKGGAGAAGSEFGDVKPVRKEPENKAVTKARPPRKEGPEEEAEEEVVEKTPSKATKRAKPVKTEEPEDFPDDDCPF